jgi:protein ImuA
MPHALIDDLRARIALLERPTGRRRAILPFGVAAVDRRLPEGGLALGALHEVAGGGLDAVHGGGHGAAATLFVAGILARMQRPVLWCLGARDLFAPALAGAGLHPDRVIYAEAGDEKTMLLCLEEGLRQGGLAGAVGEVSQLSMTASRRLQLAAESSGVTAFLLRRQLRRQAGDALAQPSAAATRWRISARPSAALPAPGVGRPRWLVELVRVRGGEGAAWELEGCDAQGCLALSAELADRPAASEDGRAAA